MKLLLLVIKSQTVVLDSLYDAIADNADCDIHRLSSSEQSNLERYFKRHIELTKYDRIILFLRFKKESQQIAFVRTIPNLVILEHDACQNYISGRYQGAFSKYYQQLPWVRVLVSGAVITRRLQLEGIDAVFVPKGYDQRILTNLNKSREVELGFIGSLKSDAYTSRRAFLEQISEKENIRIQRTAPGYEYLQALNSIRFFISADIGIDEYMIKNFEAMACGCVLFAFNQGEEENNALGFKDMENIVLYNTIEDFHLKLAILRKNSELADSIAKSGQRLAEQRYSFSAIGQQIIRAIEPELNQSFQFFPRQSFGARFRRWFFG
jgi:glycosyltransferase involved in cell wall biosynthesis